MYSGMRKSLKEKLKKNEKSQKLDLLFMAVCGKVNGNELDVGAQTVIFDLSLGQSQQ